MRRLFTIILLITIFSGLIIIADGCSSSKKGQCGCPGKQGMIGY